MVTSMQLAALFKQCGFSQDEQSRLLYILKSKRKFDPSKHRRDRLGRWTKGGPFVGAAFDKEKDGWVDQNGDPVDKKLSDRITELKIPKNMIGVKVNPDYDDPRQAVGYFLNPQTSEIGKAKYFFSDSKQSENYAKKFNTLKKFDAIKKDLEKQAFADALDGNPAAAVVALMNETAIRVGDGGKGGRSESGIGCCDLRVKHVKVRGDSVRLTFTGKSGVPFDNTYKSAKLAAIVRGFLMEGDTQKGKEDSLFGTTDDTVRAYMRKVVGSDVAKDLKPHQFRYWHGTRIATELVNKLSKSNMKKADVLEIKRQVCEEASKFLNNTPAVCFQKYIDPAVWQFIPENIPFALPKLTKAANAFTNTAMEDLFEATVYPTFGWESSLSIGDMFKDIGGEEEYKETKADRDAYKKFINNGEGFPD